MMPRPYSGTCTAKIRSSVAATSSAPGTVSSTSHADTGGASSHRRAARARGRAASR